jgi:hypothetical protein
MHGGRGRETGRRRELHQRSPGADAGAKTIRPPDRMLILDNSPKNGQLSKPPCVGIESNATALRCDGLLFALQGELKCGKR